jgi:lysophospholipase L1-like esterase
MVRFWLICLLLAPLLIVQARRTRRDTPRLPEAGGADRGREGDGGGPPLRLLVVGESTAAGVGVAEHRQGLGAHLARAFAHRRQGPVTWQVIGVNGIRAQALNQHLAGRPPADVDLVVISLGVNDTTGVTRPGHYRQHLTALIGTLRRGRPNLPVYLLAVPPMQHFTALPRPLRDLLGQRAAQLDRIQQTLAAQLQGVHHLAYPVIADPAYLAEDGYHPSEKGYAYIAEQVAEQLRAAPATGNGADVTRSP